VSGAAAQAHKDSIVLGMVLEPAPGLDPTAGSAAAIGEVVHYNVLEGLTKITMDGRVAPLLAESWSVAPDGKAWTFKLRQGVKFHDGESFDAADVRFSFERAKADGSTNKAKKAVFDHIVRIDTPDPHTVVLTLDQPDGNFPFRMGENTAVILDPKSAAGTATRPVGTGPFRFAGWSRGASITLVKNDAYRDAAAVKMKKVTLRFVNEPAAQVAALLAGDIDGMPRFGAPQNLRQFQSDKRFSVVVGGTEGKTLVGINHRRKPFDDVRVRRAIAAAIDRKAVIDGAMEGFGAPIGSHLVPSDAGYVDLTSMNPYDPAKARALLKEAGVATPLNVTLTLPPPQYARKGGEIVAAQLAQVGIRAKIENVEWGAVAVGHVQGQLRPDADQPRRAAGLRPLRRPVVLLGLRQRGVPRAARQVQHQHRNKGTHRAARRPAAPARARRGQRVAVPAAAVRGRQRAPEGHVEQLADLRQRPRGA
jgi:peptide/nickel transport system substrate-binding protein